MSLQTSLYAQMLEDDSLSATQKSAFERETWFFAPGIDKIHQSIVAKPGRGIVISFNKSMFKYACHFLATLRNVHESDLPVEVFYYGEDDLPLEMKQHLIEHYDVTPVDLEKLAIFDESFVELRHGGYAIKAFALLASSFTEVLMVDVDSILLAAPERFFEQRGYREHGTLFFRDRLIDEKSDEIHEFLSDLLGRRSPSPVLEDSPIWKEHLKHQQESGVVLVDKSRPKVLAALLFAAWQNTGPIRSLTYRLFYGDKETFWLAFELANFPYYMVQHFAGGIGSEKSEHFDGFCPDHPLHFFDFQHENGFLNSTSATDGGQLGLPAWFNGSLRKNKYHGKDDLLDASIAIWAMDGKWTWQGGSYTWCLTDYTRRSMDMYNLEARLASLVDEGRHAETVMTERPV
ncbi:hypothetical protein CBS101457_004985 [Exobasidium rhododendri]|nr:hypothetical protein CBS101457_004985 [Exobasidium rhododendri]